MGCLIYIVVIALLFAGQWGLATFLVVLALGLYLVIDHPDN